MGCPWQRKGFKSFFCFFFFRSEFIIFFVGRYFQFLSAILFLLYIWLYFLAFYYSPASRGEYYGNRVGIGGGGMVGGSWKPGRGKIFINPIESRKRFLSFFCLIILLIVSIHRNQLYYVIPDWSMLLDWRGQEEGGKRMVWKYLAYQI